MKKRKNLPLLPPFPPGENSGDASSTRQPEDFNGAQFTDSSGEQFGEERPERIIHPLDIGRFARSAEPLTDEKKYNILTDTWTPDAACEFPKVEQSGRARSSQPSYLETWKWLAYSAVNGGGAFCKVCELFTKVSHNHGGIRALKMFVHSPMNKYKKALALIRDHESLVYYTTRTRK